MSSSARRLGGLGRDDMHRIHGADDRGRGFQDISSIFPKLPAMAAKGGTRIQLCGRFVVRLNGRRVEDDLPGPKGQLLVAYVVLNRFRRLSRDELLTAVYGDDAAADRQPRL